MKKIVFFFLSLLLFPNMLTFGQEDTALIANKKINSPDTSLIFSVVENMPEFIGGETAMFEFVAKELKYPSDESEFYGTLLFQFIVEKDGSISNAKDITSLSPPPSYVKEVLRVIYMMPKWKPGTHMGKPVRCYYLFPIRISMDE